MHSHFPATFINRNEPNAEREHTSILRILPAEVHLEISFETDIIPATYERTGLNSDVNGVLPIFRPWLARTMSVQIFEIGINSGTFAGGPTRSCLGTVFIVVVKFRINGIRSLGKSIRDG